MDQDPNLPDIPEGVIPETPPPRRRRLGGSILSGLVSMVVHGAAMIGLGLFSIGSESDSGAPAVVAGTIRRPEELLTQELDAIVEPALLSAGSDTAGGFEAAPATAESVEIDGLEIPAADVTVALSHTALPDPKMDLLGELGTGLEGTAREVVTDSHQAVDRITDELTRLLLTRNVLLVWCFDQSKSIKPDRDEIRQRVRKIYEELAASPFAQGDAVLTAVTSFGKGFMVHTQQPTTDFETIEAAIDAVPEDESGVELICQAVNRAIETQRRYMSERLEIDASGGAAPKGAPSEALGAALPNWSPAVRGHQTREPNEMVLSQRQMVLILVTDESGDRSENEAYLEQTIDRAKDANCRIYVMGREASFGHPYARVRWTDTLAGTTWTVDVDRGPESAYYEVLQFDGFGRRSDIFLSGFGPYDLVRMVSQTGGTYFLLPNKGLSKEEAERRQRELDQMHQYVPETASRGEYIAARATSPLRHAIWQVISDFDAWDDDWLAEIRFLRNLPADEAKLATQAATGTEAAKRLMREYDRAIASLERVEPFRQDEPLRRWQANYDLLLAQMVAYRARLSEYLACLEPLSKGSLPETEAPKPDMELASWSLRNGSALGAPEKTQAEVDRATKLLQDVLQNHPDTPWARRAEWELKRPFGYQLVANYRAVRKPMQVAAKPKPPTLPKLPTLPKSTPPKPKPVKPKL